MGLEAIDLFVDRSRCPEHRSILTEARQARRSTAKGRFVSARANRCHSESVRFHTLGVKVSWSWGTQLKMYVFGHFLGTTYDTARCASGRYRTIERVDRVRGCHSGRPRRRGRRPPAVQRRSCPSRRWLTGVRGQDWRRSNCSPGRCQTSGCCVHRHPVVRAAKWLGRIRRL
jgi:hypothetical protein